MKHLGRIDISEALLLALLHFEGGSVYSIRFGDHSGIIEVGLEHREMPLVGEGEPVPLVYPEYIATYNKEGVVIAVTRTPLQTGVEDG